MTYFFFKTSGCSVTTPAIPYQCGWGTKSTACTLTLAIQGQHFPNEHKTPLRGQCSSGNSSVLSSEMQNTSQKEGKVLKASKRRIRKTPNSPKMAQRAKVILEEPESSQVSSNSLMARPSTGLNNKIGNSQLWPSVWS